MNNNSYSLTSYQKATVDHVAKVFKEGVRAYIVADEVGLGKTYVALGLIEELKAKRIIYIASNAEIAKQNTSKMAVKLTAELVEGDRLSMMSDNPYVAGNTYIMSLSPATTFTGKGSVEGNKAERNHYTANGESPNDIKPKFQEIRAKFNMKALKAYQPDLIIMDEFHRFHELLDPENNVLQFNLWDYINKVKNSTKLLLLSATPYQYKITDAPVYEVDEETAIDKEKSDDEFDSKPFRNLEELISYMGKINGKEYQTSQPDLGEMYDNYLCRTERNWLVNETTVQPSFEPCSDEAMDKHMEYTAKFVHERLTGETGANDDEKNKICESNYQKHEGFLGAKYAIQDYHSSVRSFLDSAPEYTQFAYKYQSVIIGRGANGNTVTADKRKDAFSKMLEAQGNYAIRKDNDTGQPCPDKFRETYGHYKWDMLREFAMPENAELLLWVLPTCCLFEKDESNILLDLREHSKTVVFAHYSMSTRAIAAMTSMEAQLRLLETIETIENNDLKVPDPDKNTLDELIKPFKELLEKQKDLTVPLKEAIKSFFSQTYAKRVLTAWAIRSGTDKDNILLDYCKAAYWNEMWQEYLELLDEKEPEEKLRACINVLNWKECPDYPRKNAKKTFIPFTTVAVMPDWKENSYQCSYGERYTEFFNEEKTNSNRTEDIRKRFLSPFYPFVLAASEVAKEGVDLHNYSAKIMHWEAPGSLAAYIQEEGRIDRRMSLTARRNIASAYRNIYKSFAEIARELRDCYIQDNKLSRKVLNSGLFPEWYLDDKKYCIERRCCFTPMSREQEYYGRLKSALSKYRSFGVNSVDDECLKQLCPYLKKPE